MLVKRKPFKPLLLVCCQILAILTILVVPLARVSAGTTLIDNGEAHTTTGGANTPAPTSSQSPDNTFNNATFEPTCQPSDTGCNVDKNGIVTEIINPLIKVFTVLVGVVAIVMLIIAGIMYSSAQDDPKRITLAKKIVVDVIIALAVYIFLFAILDYLLPTGLK